MARTKDPHSKVHTTAAMGTPGKILSLIEFVECINCGTRVKEAETILVPENCLIIGNPHQWAYSLWV